MHSAGKQADWSSIDAIIAAIYDAISFQPGGGPDWQRFATLLHPNGRLIPAGRPRTDRVPVLDVDTFAERSSAYIDEMGMREKGFLEREIGRRTESYGAIAHAMSAYESLYAGEDEPFSRGINSIQLLYEDDRWSILSIAWDVETPERPIPAAYLKGA